MGEGCLLESRTALDLPMTSIKVKGARRSKYQVPHHPGLTEEHISPERENVASLMGDCEC